MNDHPDQHEYLLSVWHDAEYSLPADAEPDEETRSMFAAVGAFNDALATAGQLVHAGGLMPGSQATVMRPEGDTVREHRGPYVSGAQVGGFWIVRAASDESARALARQAAAACGRPVELRALQG